MRAADLRPRLRGPSPAPTDPGRRRRPIPPRRSPAALRHGRRGCRARTDRCGALRVPGRWRSMPSPRHAWRRPAGPRRRRRRVCAAHRLSPSVECRVERRLGRRRCRTGRCGVPRVPGSVAVDAVGTSRLAAPCWPSPPEGAGLAPPGAVHRLSPTVGRRLGRRRCRDRTGRCGVPRVPGRWRPMPSARHAGRCPAGPRRPKVPGSRRRAPCTACPQPSGAALADGGAGTVPTGVVHCGFRAGGGRCRRHVTRGRAARTSPPRGPCRADLAAEGAGAPGARCRSSVGPDRRRAGARADACRTGGFRPSASCTGRVRSSVPVSGGFWSSLFRVCRRVSVPPANSRFWRGSCGRAGSAFGMPGNRRFSARNRSAQPVRMRGLRVRHMT